MAIVDQLFDDCLAQLSYFLRSSNDAVVIDPGRDPQPYLELARRHSVTIKYVVETHFHSDFASGHVELAQRSGAAIVFGPSAEPLFDASIAPDGAVLAFGTSTLTLLHSPGHTAESCCLFLRDEGCDNPLAVFTGDTLLIDDVGPPDVVQLAAASSQEVTARTLFRSLREKVLALPDSVTVYPGHGPGSPCGSRDVSSEKLSDSLGSQRGTNFALRDDMSEDAFVVELLGRLRPPPQYFRHLALLNKGNAVLRPFDEVIARGHRELSPGEVKDFIGQGILAIDTRGSQAAFAASHVPGSVFAGTSAALARWLAAAVPDVRQPFVICNDGEDFDEFLRQLACVGYDDCWGHLHGGVDAWIAAGQAAASVNCVTVAALAATRRDWQSEVDFLDVRGPDEYRAGRLVFAPNVPLCSRTPIDFGAVVSPTKTTTYVFCGVGYRSLMFVSLCLRAGVCSERLVNITQGGFADLAADPTFLPYVRGAAADDV